MSRVGWIATLCLVSSAVTVTHAAVPITTCGVSVAAGQVGLLTGDLTCPGDVVGVTLAAGAKLRLRGHTISGGYHGIHVLGGTTPRRASVRGPGTLQSAARCGVAMSHDLDLVNVVVQGNDECGILNPDNKNLTLRRVAILANAGDGITGSILGAGLGDGILRANRLEILGNEGIGVRLFSPGEYILRSFVIRDNGGGLAVAGPKPGVLIEGEILTHTCDLTTSLAPEERGLVRIGTRCAP